MNGTSRCLRRGSNLEHTDSKERLSSKNIVHAVHMVFHRPMYPIYGGTVIHTVLCFHRLSSDLHHICTSGDAREGNTQALKFVALDLVCSFDALLHHAGLFTQAAVAQLFIFDARHLDVDVDAIQPWSRDELLVFSHRASRAGASFDRILVITTWTGVWYCIYSHMWHCMPLADEHFRFSQLADNLFGCEGFLWNVSPASPRVYPFSWSIPNL